jgi:hypothetical protein
VLLYETCKIPDKTVGSVDALLVQQATASCTIPCIKLAPDAKVGICCQANFAEGFDAYRFLAIGAMQFYNR